MLTVGLNVCYGQWKGADLRQADFYVAEDSTVQLVRRARSNQLFVMATAMSRETWRKQGRSAWVHTGPQRLSRLRWQGVRLTVALTQQL